MTSVAWITWVVLALARLPAATGAAYAAVVGLSALAVAWWRHTPLRGRVDRLDVVVVAAIYVAVVALMWTAFEAFTTDRVLGLFLCFAGALLVGVLGPLFYTVWIRRRPLDDLGVWLTVRHVRRSTLTTPRQQKGSLMNGIRRALESPLTALVSMWVAAALMAIAAPDMVSGSQHEHLPLSLITVWMWAGAASAYAMMTPARGSLARWTLAVAGLWVATALLAVAAPVPVTGTDPTPIPLAVIIAPPVAAVLTGMLSLHQANLPEPGEQGPAGQGLATHASASPRS